MMRLKKEIDNINKKNGVNNSMKQFMKLIILAIYDAT